MSTPPRVPNRNARIDACLLRTDSGYQLRSDDPSALKEIIQVVHSKLPEQSNALRYLISHTRAVLRNNQRLRPCINLCCSSRTRFMVETLTNLKNNKTKRNASQAGGVDASERLKKFLSGLNKRRHGRCLWLRLSLGSVVIERYSFSHDES